MIDNLVTGRRSNIDHLSAHPSVQVVEHDITQPLPSNVTAMSFDTVLDFACPCAPVDYERMPLEIMEVASTGTRALLELAVATRARFVLASTSEVYGNSLAHPLPETNLGSVSTIDPQSSCFEARRFSEALTMAYQRTQGLDVQIIRIFNTYGDRMRPDDGRAVTSFISQALAGGPIVVFGDGEQTRGFTYVHDVVEGVLRVMESGLSGPLNLGAAEGVSVRALAQLVRELVDRNVEIVTAEPPTARLGEPRVRVPDLAELEAELLWVPTTKLEEGLDHLVGPLLAALTRSETSVRLT